MMTRLASRCYDRVVIEVSFPCSPASYNNEITLSNTRQIESACQK